MSNEFYNKPEIYDLGFKSRSTDLLEKYYGRVLGNKEIETIHDCSFGTGHLSLILAEMGYQISGSDISEEMLVKAKKNITNKGLDIELFQSDFREISKKTQKKFDCIMSTGNSIAHVNNSEVKATLKEMSNLINNNGYLYIDTRNWNKIIQTKQRFYHYNPFFEAGERINLVQVWDYISEEEMRFNLLYTFEKENRIIRTEELKLIYYPVSKELLVDELEKLGFEDIEINSFIRTEITDFNEMDWYSIIAKKVKRVR